MKVNISQEIELNEYILECSIGEIILFNRYLLDEDEEPMKITEDLLVQTIIGRFVDYGMVGLYDWSDTLPDSIFEQTKECLPDYLYLLD